MAVRHEKVVLSLEDHFTTDLARAAAAAAAADKALKGMNRTVDRTPAPMRQVARESDNLTRSVNRSTNSINQLTGRLRLMADAAAVLGPSLVPIGAVAVPAVTGLASQLGFAALGMGSLVTASQGVGDALKAVNEAALEPTADNLAKAREEMAKLGPEAQRFVSRFQELRPTLLSIRDAAAAGWFPGLTDALDSLDVLAPRVAKMFETIGRTGGNLVAEGAANLAGPEWADFLRFLQSDASSALTDLGRTIGNVAKGMAELWMAFDPLNDSFGDWLLDASRGFADWAEGLAATEGFAEFVDYIRTNGPRVAAALKAVGEAVLEIIEALAPLGGPSLKIIETFANAVAAIADSDMGTPIFAAVAALALFNRTMKVTEALQARIGLAQGSTLLASARTRTAGLRSDAALIAAGRATAGARTEREAARLSAATSRMHGRAAAGATALVGLGAAGAAAAGGLNLTNTALLSLAGPLGTAAGLFLDLSASGSGAKDAIEGVNAAMKSGNAEQMAQALDAVNAQMAKLDDRSSISGVGDFFDDYINPAGQFDQITGYAQDQLSSLGIGQSRHEALRIAQYNASQQGAITTGSRMAEVQDLIANGLFEVGDAAAKAARETEHLRQNYADLQFELDQSATYDRFQESIDRATQALKDNGRTLDANTEKGRANKAALRDIVDAGVAYAQTLTGIDRVDALKNTRAAFVRMAEDMGGVRGGLKDILGELDDLITRSDPKITIKAATDTAEKALRRVRDLLGGINSKSIGVSVTSKIKGFFGNYDTGGYTGPGGKHDVAGLVHRGEVVIPADLVKRDWSMLKSRYGHLQGFAEGGYVQSMPVPSAPIVPSPSTAVMTDPAVVARLAAIEAAIRGEHATDRKSSTASVQRARAGQRRSDLR